MCSIARKQEIKDVLFNNDKNKSWLKTKLSEKGFEVDVYYLLDEDKSKRFDLDVYDAIQEIFKAEGLIATESERAKKLTSEIFHIDAMIGHSLSILNTTVEAFVSDDFLSFDEKRRLVSMLEKFESETLTAISNTKKVITR